MGNTTGYMGKKNGLIDNCTVEDYKKLSEAIEKREYSFNFNGYQMTLKEAKEILGCMRRRIS